MLLALALVGCSPFTVAPRELVTPEEGFFADISDPSGIRVDNFAVEPPAGMVINDHSRLAFADLNGDGRDDIVMHSLFPNADNGVPFEHLVFLNDGDGFHDFSDDSGLRDVQAAFFAFGDVDDDGDQDLFAGLDLVGYAKNTVWLNDGAGHFTQVDDAGVEAATATVAGAVFADFDGDAVLDLYVAHGSTMYLERDTLWLGNGDGTFDDASDQLESRPRQPSNGVVACDWDDDGDQDVFVSTYSVSTEGGLNHLWQNDGTGHFTEVGVEKGFASMATGNSWLSGTEYGTEPEPDAEPGTYIGSNGFGIDCADVTGDGLLDVLVTAISHPVSSDYYRKWSDPTMLLVNQGPDGDYTFVNEWQTRGLPFNEGDVDGGLPDLDNDGRLDISISRDRKYEGNYDDVDQKAWFGLMRQDEAGMFASLGYVSGVNDPDGDLLRMKGAQNHAWSDVDGDGDLDLLVGGRDQGGGRPNFLFENTLGQDNRWLQVVIEGDGDAVTRDAFGTRVTLRQDDIVRVREKKSSRGMYNSEDTRVLQFGLDGLDRGAELDVRWPDGTTATFKLGKHFGDDARITLVYPDVLEIE